MKGYCILLAVLYVIHVVMGVFEVVVAPHDMRVLKLVIDAVVFALCLVGCFGLAYRKALWSPLTWRVIYQATLVMGCFFFFAQGFGDSVGIDHPDKDAGLLNLMMNLLNYLLFAVPVIVYEHALRRGEWPGEGKPEQGL